MWPTPDDSSAVYHNPAGLVLVEGLRFDASGTNVFTNTAYTRVDYPYNPAPHDPGPADFDTSRKPSGPCPAEGDAAGYDANGYVLEPCFRPRVQPKTRYGVLPFGGAAWNPGWKGLRNLAFGLGVGGRYSPRPWLDLRAGLFFDQSPYPSAYYTTLSPDADKYGFTTGFSFKPRRLRGAELSLAYMVLFYADRIVTDSQSRPEYGSLAPFSANGQVVDKVVHLLVVQLGWTLGAKR